MPTGNTVLESDQLEAESPRERSTALTVGGATAIFAAVLVALRARERGDNYCGRLLFDTSPIGACTDSNRFAITLVACLAATGVGLLLYAAFRSKSRVAGVVTMLALVTLAAVLGMVNRLFEPTTRRWCGSVLNRHRTGSSELEAACDQLLRPHVWMAAGFAAAAVIACSGIFATHRYSRSSVAGPI